MITDCIFCKILKGEMPADFMLKNSKIAVIKDINPKAPVHLLLMPVKHIESVRSVRAQDKQILAELFYTAKNIGRKMGLDKNGYKLVINNGVDAGQLVYHLHIHLLAGWQKKRKWEV